MMESRFPAEVQSVFKNMETNATPWAFSCRRSRQLGRRTFGQDHGRRRERRCSSLGGLRGSYDDRNKKVLRAFASFLKKAGVKFAILGTEEQCTGDPARRIGNEYLYQTLAKANIETLNRYQVKKIVTACPHCFNTIKNEYKDFGGNYEVLHHSQFIAKLISRRKNQAHKDSGRNRHFPRQLLPGPLEQRLRTASRVLKALPSVRMVEMKSNHDQSMCCGAGGGRMWMEEKIGKRINVTRTEQALDTHAGIVASSCPFCMTMMTDGVKTKEMQTRSR